MSVSGRRVNQKRKLRTIATDRSNPQEECAEQLYFWRVALVVAKISHRAGADMDSKLGSLNPAESQLLSTEPQQLTRDI